jgi:hypothetical protein
MLTAQPRPATIARPVTVTAIVKNRGRAGGTPIGDVTFWDGATVLVTVTLRRGKATVKTSSLPLGADAIRATYAGSQDFAPSTATIIENVRAHRSKSKATASLEAARSRRAVASPALVSRVGGAVANPTDAVTLLVAPRILGPIVLDRGKAPLGA